MGKPKKDEWKCKTCLLGFFETTEEALEFTEFMSSTHRQAKTRIVKIKEHLYRVDTKDNRYAKHAMEIALIRLSNLLELRRDVVSAMLSYLSEDEIKEVVEMVRNQREIDRKIEHIIWNTNEWSDKEGNIDKQKGY